MSESRGRERPGRLTTTSTSQCGFKSRKRYSRMSALSSATRTRPISRATGSRPGATIGRLRLGESHWPVPEHRGAGAGGGGTLDVSRRAIRSFGRWSEPRGMRHRERAPASDDALHPHGPAVRFDQLADEREADPASPRSSGRAPPRCDESVRRASGSSSRRDAGAGVAYGELDVTSPPRAGGSRSRPRT